LEEFGLEVSELKLFKLLVKCSFLLNKKVLLAPFAKKLFEEKLACGFFSEAF